MKYTIGIKRKHLPGYRKCKAIKHYLQAEIKAGDSEGKEVTLPCATRLVIIQPDRSMLIIEDIHSREWKVYPNFFKE